MVTRREVAEAAGVSVRTVSNVVNGFVHVAEPTRRRVLEAVERLGYRPSEMARSLKVGRTGLIGLMLPDLETPYFAELTRDFVEEGAARGFTVVIDQTDGDLERETSLLARAARGGLFDALVLSPIALRAHDVTARLPDSPLVFLGETDVPGFDHVAIDNREAARVAVRHLVERGHRRIAAIGWRDDGNGTVELRTAGYLAALEEAGLAVPSGGMPLTGGFGRRFGAETLRTLVDGGDPPDAVFCFSDSLALGALRAAHDAGLRVPDDLAVVGFDDAEDGRYSVPSLTSVSPDKRWIAHTAFTRIARRLAGEDMPAETLVAPFRLVVRESSGG